MKPSERKPLRYEMKECLIKHFCLTNRIPLIQKGIVQIFDLDKRKVCFKYSDRPHFPPRRWVETPKNF